jgi:ubiquinol-cytochrome c reductase cytochrome c subunit
MLYTVHCSSCHGLRGSGSLQAPPLRGVGAAAVDFMLTTGRMPMADPHQPMLRQPPRFARAEIAALIAYIGSLGPSGPPIPTVHPEQGNLVHGGRLFANHCAACHGADGQGAAVGEGQVAPSLHEATPTQIAEAVRIGPGPMPKFGDQVLSASDLNGVVRYVVFLQHLPDPGGVGLGHEGPVIEGFVAWLVGLGLMLVIARLIGTTT